MGIIKVQFIIVYARCLNIILTSARAQTYYSAPSLDGSQKISLK